YQQPQPIRPVQLAWRLHLDVLAQPVQADLLGAQDLVAYEGVAREGVEPLRMERLVERELQVDRLVVERDVAVIGPGQVHDRDLAHSEIALYAIVAQSGVDLVQEWVLERPPVDVRDRHLERYLVGPLRYAPDHRGDRKSTRLNSSHVS